MTITPDQRLDLEVIEALDFDFDPPCDNGWHGRKVDIHGGPAYAMVSMSMSCGCHFTSYYCKPFVEALPFIKYFICRVCERAGQTADYRLIALVRP